MEALHDVVRAGKARYLGASSMWAWQFAKAQHVAELERLDAVRVDAEPLQPDLPRGGAGDAPALRGPGRRRDPVEPARRAGRLTRDWDAETARSETDELGANLYRDEDRAIVDTVGGGRGAARRLARPGRRWPGCCTSRPSPRRSSASPRPQHLADAVAAVDLELSADDLAELGAGYRAAPGLRARLMG